MNCINRLESQGRNAIARMFNIDPDNDKVLQNYETYVKYLSDLALMRHHKDELIEMLSRRQPAGQIFTGPKLSAFKRHGITVCVPDKYWGNGGRQNKTVLTDYGYKLLKEVLIEEWMNR